MSTGDNGARKRTKGNMKGDHFGKFGKLSESCHFAEYNTGQSISYYIHYVQDTYVQCGQSIESESKNEETKDK
jgi:hypothetical protein